MISVIIPVYNAENYIHICLNSLIKQTFEDFEVICIDDASTDSSLEILKYFSQKESRIKIHENKEKKGLNYCKDKGIELSNGQKIAVLHVEEWLRFNTLNEISKKNRAYHRNNFIK